MSEELREKMKLIQSLIEDDEPDNLDETVAAFKDLMNSDVNHEVNSDDFLKLYTGAMKKYRKPFEDEMAEALQQDTKHAVERKFIAIAKYADGMDSSREVQSKKVVKGFAELLNMEAAEGNFPYKSTAALMGSILNIYKEYGAEEKIKEVVKDSKYGKPLNDWVAVNKVQKEINRMDYPSECSEFAYKLNTAKRWNDSKEYRAIITELESLRDNPFNTLTLGGFRAKEYKGLTDNQIKAIPYVRLYTKVEQYLQHKAKDGVNRNAYDKLDLVEQLSKYVGSKIEELNPGTFSYPDPKDKEKTIEFAPNLARRTYADEYNAMTSYLRATMKDRSIYAKLKIKTTDIGTAYDAKEFVRDTSNDGIKPTNEKEKNIKDCLDRIMLRAQVMPENLKKTLQYAETHIERPKKTVPDHLTKAKQEFKEFLASPEKNAPVKEDGPVV